MAQYLAQLQLFEVGTNCRSESVLLLLAWVLILGQKHLLVLEYRLVVWLKIRLELPLLTAGSLGQGTLFVERPCSVVCNLRSGRQQSLNIERGFDSGCHLPR